MFAPKFVAVAIRLGCSDCQCGVNITYLFLEPPYHVPMGGASMQEEVKVKNLPVASGFSLENTLGIF